MKVLAFGEILWDIYPDNKYIGGAPFNYAAHFVKCGGNAYLCSAVGRDLLGDETFTAVKTLNVNTEYIFRNEKQTGQCIVTLDNNSVPSYRLLDDTAYDAVSVPEITSDFDVLYFGTLALRSEHNRACIQKIIEIGTFDEIFVDVNIRKPFISQEALDIALNNATILKISDEELPFVADLLQLKSQELHQAAAELCERFSSIKIVIITMGDVGSIVYDKKSKKFEKCSAQKVNTVSTVGAGDSFSAAFTAKYLSGNPLSECVKFATKISGFVVSQKDAIPDYNLMKD